MVLKAALLLALASAVASKCVCSRNYTSTVPSFVINGAYDDETFENCSPQKCLIVINQNNPARGVGGFVINEFVQAGSRFTVTIRDGDNPQFALTRANYHFFTDALAAFVSRTSSVTIELAYNGDLNVSFNMYAFWRDLEPTRTPVTGATYPPPLARAGNLGVDLGIVIDLAGDDEEAFTAMKNTIKMTISELSVHQDPKKVYGARLSLQYLSANGTGANNMFEPWSASVSDVMSALDQMPTGSPTANYTSALSTFLNLNGSFSTNSSYGASSRKNVQLIYAIFTQHEPDDIAGLSKLISDQRNPDVHVVFHWFRATPSVDFRALSAYYPNVAYLPYDPANPFNLYNNYILTGDTDPRFGCGGGRSETLLLNGRISSYYWPPLFRGTSANYCNNQASTLTIIDYPESTKTIYINVAQYELEMEKDYIRFFDSEGTEQGSVTGGNGGQGPSFTINGSSATVTFTTNEYLAYSGVFLLITPYK
ncbi:unnamed protein product, partial [Mesorhabditis spiculigera]